MTFLCSWARPLLTGIIAASLSAAPLAAFEPPGNILHVPEVGSATLRLISPTFLELGLVTTKSPPPARPAQWDFVTANYQLRLPTPAQFQVRVNGQPVSVAEVGFRRRPIYAPMKKRDLRLGNCLYLRLETPVSDGQVVEVQQSPGARLWPTNAPTQLTADPLRWSPAVHASQAGYHPDHVKKAMAGYFLGSFGELEVPANAGFHLLDASSGQTVYTGVLQSRPDVGYTYTPRPYQRVYEADFTEFRTPGQYALWVPGLGTSFPFRINEGVPACFARTYALGLYHQRCGTANELPYTRHTHAACHLANADVPTMTFAAVNKALAEFSADFANTPSNRHTAPQLKNIDASLYPFVSRGKLDVSGGHHDAGDYSKYTINSAQLIHALVFAVDSLPGVAGLDNLGLPESGDGISDLLQEAKWEADFLARLQDEDGGFYFLVYPRNREYEDNVLPDRGDPQVVFPKNTSATAAAVAALMQSASSPLFKRTYPEAAALYADKALKGWTFLQNAIAQHGRDGAYQKISHYGHEFLHDDELAWAAAELFASTGDPAFQAELMSHYDPADRNTRRHTWWRLFEGYGCAVRSYAFAARSGRLQPSQLDSAYLAKCEAEIRAAADDQVRFARENAYGSSFPDPNKAFRTAGWYFSTEQAFDIVVGHQLESKSESVDAMISNMDFEAGRNPVNAVFLTGLGYRRQLEIVHQYAQNDRRVLPQSGIPIGNIQGGFTDLPLYPAELSALCFPPDRGTPLAYAPYDIWSDTYNANNEPVTAQQGRSLAAVAWLMAQTTLAQQPWRPAVGEIVHTWQAVPVGFTNYARFTAEGIDLAQAQIVWEGRNQLPGLGAAYEVTPAFLGPQWVEAEALLPDGRRVFAATAFDSVPTHPVTALGRSKVRITGIPGQEFMLQSSVDLKDWVPVTTNTFADDSFEFTDQDLPGAAARFYRAVAMPRQ